MPQTWIISAGPDQAIQASLYTAHNRAKAVIIIAHGFKGFKDWGMFPYVAEALRSGYHVVTFNFSHNGIG